MQYKVIAVYKKPSEENQASFEDHFRTIHTPICLAIPGIKGLRINSIFGGPKGASELSMIVEMLFDDKDNWKQAMQTKEMMDSGKDAVKFAGELVSVHFAKEEIITA
jgi:uncharacterized protein (TIGR02118 family)